MLRPLLCLAVLVGANPVNHLAAAESAPAIVWTDIRELGVEGQGWTDTKAPYDRLPAKAEGKVRGPVWNLSRQSAGLCVRFVTEAREIHARWILASGNLAMPHMAATGGSSFKALRPITTKGAADGRIGGLLDRWIDVVR